MFDSMRYKDRFIKYIVCPKCHTLYNFDDCYELVCGRKVTKKCTFVQFPNHRQHFRRTKCGEPLLKEVSLKSGGTKLYPHKVYCYNSIIDNLCQFLQRPGFVDKCELWRSRGIPDGFLADIFDGRIWKEWQNVDGKAFLAAQRNGNQSTRRRTNSPTPTRRRIKSSRDVGELVVNPIQLIRREA